MLTWDQKQCTGGYKGCLGGGGGGQLNIESQSPHEPWTYLRGDFSLWLQWHDFCVGVGHGTALICQESLAAMIGLRPAGVLRSSWVALWSDQCHLSPPWSSHGLQHHVVHPDSAECWRFCSTLAKNSPQIWAGKASHPTCQIGDIYCKATRNMYVTWGDVLNAQR